MNRISIGALFALYLFGGCNQVDPQVCHGDEITFLAMGDIVGDWGLSEERPVDDRSAELRFDREGHLQMGFFGCKSEILPLVLGDSNSFVKGSGGRYGLITLTNAQIDPGHFRLTYDRDGDTIEIHGDLVTPDEFQLSSPGDSNQQGSAGWAYTFFRWPDESTEEETTTQTETSSSNSSASATTTSGSKT